MCRTMGHGEGNQGRQGSGLRVQGSEDRDRGKDVLRGTCLVAAKKMPVTHTSRQIIPTLFA